MWLYIIGATFSTSCTKQEKENKDVLFKINGESLCLNENIEKIPIGLNPSDSVALFKAVIDDWVKNKILVDFAEARLFDVANIEKMVKDYQNKLIILEYLQRMRESFKPVIEEEEINKYYEYHKNELILEQPLIKGVFMVVNSNSKGKNEIKKLLSSESENNIDILEKNWFDQSVRYEYFKDKWVDWESIADLIPFRFNDPDQFLNETQYFEIEKDGLSYFLQICDLLPSGSVQPYEYAASWISDIISYGELAEYEKNLVESLIKKSVEEKKLEIIGYDPISHEMTASF
ncbi:MAG: hypothetical protein J1E95_06235 [Muribaculaceae bacterium]|nr:hypothetical protein [Muribaculaceae bacterium]